MWTKFLTWAITPSAMFAMLKGAAFLAVLGWGAWWYADYRDGQRAQASREALCQGLAVEDCNDQGLVEAITALRDSLDKAKVDAETATARASSAATDADAALMAADAARTRANELVRRMATLRGDLDKVRQDPQMRELLEAPVPGPIAELLPGAKE